MMRSLIFILSILLILAGCTNTNNPSNTAEPSATPEPVPTATMEAPPEEDEEPPLRDNNFFGIHTMIYDGDNIDQHLDWAHHLVGDGGYIKQMIGPIMPGTEGASSQWVNIVKGIYERQMIPILRVTTNWLEEGYWSRPQADADGSFKGLAEAIKRVVSQLPLKAGVPLYIEVFNEPNLLIEWENQRPDPAAYGRLLVDVSSALKSIGDPRIKVLNGALSPGGNYNNVAFVEAMVRDVPDSLYAFDYWASHPYPANHPPEYNNHDGTANYRDFAIDSYMLETAVLEKYGRKDIKVILTETGYDLGNKQYAFEGMPEITAELQADYTLRAFRDYWSKWEEIIAVTPFELSAVKSKNWTRFDWVDIASGSDENGYPTVPMKHYELVAGLKKPPYEPDPELAGTEDVRMEAGAAADGNIGPLAKASASSSIEDYGWSVAKINNGFTTDSDLGWTSAGEQQEEWVEYQWDEPVRIGRVMIRPRSDGMEAGKYFPQGYEIFVSKDGEEWLSVAVKKAPAEVYKPIEPDIVTFEPVQASRLKLVIGDKTNHGDGGFHAQISELAVYPE